LECQRYTDGEIAGVYAIVTVHKEKSVYYGTSLQITFARGIVT